MLLFMMEKANNCFSAILKGRVSKLIYFLLWYMLTYLRFDEFTFLFFFFITRGFNLDHFMGNRWGNSGNSVRLYFFGLQNQITADCDSSHEIKRHLLLGRKVMTNLDRIFKSMGIGEGVG